MRSPKGFSGFTLVELTIVMVVMAMVAAVCLVFMQRTFAGYAQARDRLLLAEQGRLALNRIKRETRLALPNSVRVAAVGGLYYLEFVPVSAAGRYRVGSATGVDSAPACPADSASVPDNGVLTVGLSDTCFKTLGLVDTSGSSPGDWVVVFNAGPGYPGSDFYETGPSTGGNKAVLSLASATGGETRVAFAANVFTWDSPGHRFYLAKNPVSYVCDPASQLLTRWSGYPVQASQPTTGLAGLAGASSAALLRKVGGCQISYAPSAISSQFGLVTLNVSLATPSGDPLSLQVQSLVSNAP